jgi:CubicO group peptidase (beta-lactamase class C family)
MPPIQKYCAAFPDKPWPVTARQLLGHLGGIRHYTKPGEQNGTTHYFTIEESLKIFKDDPLLHEPGSKFHYTTYGYSLLGCAIEGAAGRGYEDYMHENIFKSAGMTHTRIDDHFSIVPERARGYLKLDEQTYAQLPAVVKGKVKVGQLYNAQLHDTSMKVPGGGLVSTAEDLVKFGHALMKGTLVKQATLEQMWTPQQTKDGNKTTYGLGWGISERAGMKLISHSGGQAGTSTLLYVLPEKNIVIAAMCNLEGASLGPMLDGVGKSLVGSPNP